MADVASPMQIGSLSELRARHLDLLERWTPDMAPEAVAELVPLAETLRADARSLGVWLDDGDDRDRAQGIIDYWTAALMGLSGHGFPEMMRLEPFDPALPAAAAERAEAIVAPNDGTPREEDAETMLFGLVRVGANGRISCRGPTERGDLIRADAGEAVQAGQAEMLDRLVEAGIIHRMASDAGDEDRYEFANGSIARAWPRLNRWLEQRRTVSDTREKLKATAQLWKQSGDLGFLLAGDALDKAGNYLGEDNLLNEFIAASRRAEVRRRRQWTYLSTTLVLIIAGLLYFWGGYRYGAGEGEGEKKGIDTAQQKQAEIVGSETAVEAPARLDEEGPGLAGWIWAGSETDPQLADRRSGAAAEPASLVVGESYLARTNIWLRNRAPNDDYESGDRISFVRRGGLVVLREAPRQFDRQSGVQYWVRVRSVPRVFIHYANAPANALQPLRSGLVEAGYEAPPMEATRNAANVRDVRYFRPEHREVAVRLAQQLAANISREDGSPIEIRCVRPKGVDGVHLEIWLDMRELRLARPRADAQVPAPICL